MVLDASRWLFLVSRAIVRKKFLSDILNHGFFLNDQRLAQLYVRDGPDRMLEMIQWGVKPTTTDEPSHQYDRYLHHGTHF